MDWCLDIEGLLDYEKISLFSKDACVGVFRGEMS